MKIAMLIDWRKPIYWGGQIHVENLCKQLVSKYSCKIDLFVRKLKDEKWKAYNKDETINDKIILYRVWYSSLFFSFFARIYALIATTIFLWYKTYKEKYDLIHAHAYVSWIPAKIIWFIFKIPVVYTVHGANNLETKKNDYYLQ